MRHMKKITSLLMSAACIFFIACGADGGNGINNNSYLAGLTVEAESSERWIGHWKSSNGIDNGTISLDLTASAAALKGSSSMSGFPCMTDGNISGSIYGQNINFDIVSISGKDVVSYSGRVTSSSMNGRYAVLNWACALDHGTFSLTKQ
jgi:hypothetical protein